MTILRYTAADSFSLHREVNVLHWTVVALHMQSGRRIAYRLRIEGFHAALQQVVNRPIRFSLILVCMVAIKVYI